MKNYKCTRCKTLLPVSKFHKDSSKKGGHYTICKKCRSADPKNIMDNLIGNAKKRAKRHNVPYEITRQFILELNKKQNGKCALSGITLNWKPCKMQIQRVCPPDRVSLDRIIPKFGYVPENVQLVTDFVNRIKMWYPGDDIILFCRMIIDNRAV